MSGRLEEKMLTFFIIGMDRTNLSDYGEKSKINKCKITQKDVNYERAVEWMEINTKPHAVLYQKLSS